MSFGYSVCHKCGTLLYYDLAGLGVSETDRMHAPICRVIKSEKELSLACGYEKCNDSNCYVIDCDECRGAYYCNEPTCQKGKTWNAIVNKSNQNGPQTHAHFFSIQMLCNQPNGHDQVLLLHEDMWLSTFSNTNKAVLTYEENWLLDAFQFTLNHHSIEMQQLCGGPVPLIYDPDLLEAPALILKPDTFFAEYVDTTLNNTADMNMIMFQKLAQQVLYSVCIKLTMNYEAKVTPEMVMKLVHFAGKVVAPGDVATTMEKGQAIFPMPTYNTYLLKKRARLLLYAA